MVENYSRFGPFVDPYLDFLVVIIVECEVSATLRKH